MAHYLLNLVSAEARERPAPRAAAARMLRLRMWGIAPSEPHGGALAAGDLVLVYLGAPDRELIGCAELASAVHDWTPAQAKLIPGQSTGGVLLAHVEEWEPPVPMNAVLAQLERPETARADFATGVVRITADEFATAVAVATARTSSP